MIVQLRESSNGAGKTAEIVKMMDERARIKASVMSK
jgi:hypothetical protein